MNRQWIVSCAMIIMATCQMAQAQPDTLWAQTYGGVGFGEYCNQVQQTTDGGFVFAGQNGFQGGIFPWLVKTDADGGITWDEVYFEATTNTWFSSVEQTSDGGFAAGGISRANWNTSRIDYYLVKADSSGHTDWSKTYGTPGYRWDYGESVVQTSDGGFIFGGNTAPGPNPYEFFLVRTDASGDTVWTRTYGDGGSGNERAHSVVQTSDNAFIMAGYTDSFGAGSWDFYVVKVDTNGDTLWTKTYGGSSGEEAFCVQETFDNGLVIAGYSTSYGAGQQDFYVVKTDAVGDVIWERTYGGAQHDYAKCVKQTPDGGFIVVGSTASFGAGFTDMYIVRTDASGDTLWTRAYGGYDDERAYSVDLTLDGGYIVGGHTSTFGAGDYDVWLLRFERDESGTAGLGPSDKVTPLHCRNYPNPFVSGTVISFELPHESDVLLSVYDAEGTLLKTLLRHRQAVGLHRVAWNRRARDGEVPSGVYFLRIRADGLRETKRMVCIR